MMPENKQIHHILSTLPNGPGIYKMIDTEGRVIYLGKAKDIKKRVKQYFQRQVISRLLALIALPRCK